MTLLGFLRLSIQTINNKLELLLKMSYLRNKFVTLFSLAIFETIVCLSFQFIGGAYAFLICYILILIIHQISLFKLRHHFSAKELLFSSICLLVMSVLILIVIPIIVGNFVTSHAQIWRPIGLSGFALCSLYPAYYLVKLLVLQVRAFYSFIKVTVCPFVCLTLA